MKHVMSTIFLIVALVQATIAVLDKFLGFLAEGQGFSLILCGICTMIPGLGFAYLESKFDRR